jgi:hypothetical protein
MSHCRASSFGEQFIPPTVGPIPACHSVAADKDGRKRQLGINDCGVRASSEIIRCHSPNYQNEQNTECDVIGDLHEIGPIAMVARSQLLGQRGDTFDTRSGLCRRGIRLRYPLDIFLPRLQPP